MRGPIQNTLRLFTRTMRPLALRSIAAQNDDRFLIALPYGKRTDWLKNVLGKGSAIIVNNGHIYEVDRPEVVPMTEATAYFRPREQRMHRQFHVDSALQVHLRQEAHQ